jgi:hypothetical protein
MGSAIGGISFDLEGLLVARGLPVDLNPVHPGPLGARPAQPDHPVDLVSWAFEDRLYATIPEVANPTRDALLGRFIRDGLTEAQPLDLPIDEYVHAGLVFQFRSS